ncbi:MAG: PilZ domain-containing protein [Chlorobium sp.]|nr:PilZ domain-containing protein [Chlorobium sp.]
MKKKYSSSQKELSQEAPLLKEYRCPYWDLDSQFCQLVKDGLLIPAKQHVVCYCLSLHYPSCPQYELLAGTEPALPINRRRSVRVPRNHHFRFFTITGSGQAQEKREYEAWTIDLSEHGLRCTGLYLLPPRTAIRFFLDTDETGSRAEGTGSIIWSQQVKNKPLFHSGVAFNHPLPIFYPKTVKYDKIDRIGPQT